MNHAPARQAEALYEDLLRLPIDDPLAEANGYSSQGYILLVGDDAVIIDASDEVHLPALRKLRDEGRRLLSLVLTHVDRVPEGDVLRRFHDELAIPIYLHPADADSVRAKAACVRYSDPTRSEDLAALGVEAALFPGHSPGHVILISGAHGGVLFSGDAALGPSREEHSAGRGAIARPPASLNYDDAELRRSWASFDRKVTSVLPLHGEVFLERAQDWPALLSALRRPERTPEFMSPRPTPTTPKAQA